MAKQPKNAHIGGLQLPLIVPDSTWTPPTSLPDLRRCPVIALDTEGNDEGLSAGQGSGWPFGAGHLCGVSVAWEGGSFYAPTRHPETECLDPGLVARWVDDHAKAGVKIITHHGSHDWGWMRSEWGLKCAPSMGDTEAASMIVDENRLNYSLDDLCRWRGLVGKDEDGLREAAAAYGFHGKQVKANMWRLPGCYVGPYAAQDAVATLALWNNLQPEIEAQGLGAALQLEHDLMPMVLEMRLRGMRVDLEGAKQSKVKLRAQRDDVLKQLSELLEHTVGIDDCRSPKTMERWFDRHKIGYPRTAKTHQGSFQASWMRKHAHPLPRLVARAEQLEEAASKFIQGFILNYSHKGRLHASINQYRGEEGGTRSYRFSYSDPALQQMHSRDVEMARIIRGCFLPEEGELWCSSDYSQQEYRLIVHFATLLGCEKATEAAQRYRDDPSTDFHLYVAEITGLERKPAKDTNFAKAFGAGIAKFAAMTGMTEERAKEVMEQYDTELPFVKELGQVCDRAAARRGYVRLLDGARSHFDMYEPAWRENGVAYAGPRPEAQARELWKGKRLRRAFTHKAMNRLIQGSAARQTKLWMRACWREGLVPLLQMHDELCHSISSPEQKLRIAELGEQVVPLEVPMRVEADLGHTWGEAKCDPMEEWE